jgi:predicted glutamine amidotransferase
MLAVYAGHNSVSARYWLLGAPNDLRDQSRLNPDGAGIGWFDESGQLRLDRAPIEALNDPAFAWDAREVRSRALIAHVRHSSGTPRRLENTMPFEREGRLFAHNGELSDLSTVEALAGPWASGMVGDTDSERYLALITRRADALGSLAAGLSPAAAQLAASVPVLSLNCIMATPDELVALRYPETDTLWLLVRRAGPGLSGSGSDGPIRMDGDHVADSHVVVASEPLDGDQGWRQIESGELIHVDIDLQVTSIRALTDPPAWPIPLR